MLGNNERPEGNYPGPNTIKLKAMCTVAQHVAHGRVVAQYGPEIQQMTLCKARLDGRHRQARRDHNEGAKSRNQKSVPPPVPIRYELCHKKRKPDAERKARCIECDAA